MGITKISEQGLTGVPNHHRAEKTKTINRRLSDKIKCDSSESDLFAVAIAAMSINIIVFNLSGKFVD